MKTRCNLLSGVFYSSASYFLRHGLSLNLELVILAKLLGSRPLGATGLHLPVLELRVYAAMPGF